MCAPVSGETHAGREARAPTAERWRCAGVRGPQTMGGGPRRPTVDNGAGPSKLAGSSSQKWVVAVQAWQLHEAKARFSAVVNAAMAGQHQLVTRRGEPAVVVIAAEY